MGGKGTNWQKGRIRREKKNSSFKNSPRLWRVKNSFYPRTFWGHLIDNSGESKIS